MLVIILSALACSYIFWFIGPHSVALTAIAAAGVSFALTNKFCRDEKYPGSVPWIQGIQSSILALIHHLPLVYWDQLTGPQAGFVLMAWSGIFLLYFAAPSRHTWPMAWFFGAAICGWAATILHAGLVESTSAWGYLGTILAIVVQVVGTLKVTEYAGHFGWMFMTCPNPGDCRFILYKDELWQVVFNPGGVPKSRRQPPNHLVFNEHWEEVWGWQEHNHAYSAHPYNARWLVIFPGVYLVPILKHEAKLKHPFMGPPHADTDHPHEEPAGFFKSLLKGWRETLHAINPASCRLIVLPDVDISKPAEMGQAALASELTFGATLICDNPRLLWTAYHAEHSIDEVWEGLVNAIGQHQGPNAIGFAGRIERLYEDRPGFDSTFFTTEMRVLRGTPALEDDIDHERHHLHQQAGVRMDNLMVKKTKQAAAVEEARNALVKARAEQVTAPMRAETLRLVQNASFQGLVDSLRTSPLNAEQQAKVLEQAATFIYAGDNAGLMGFMAKIGIMGGAASNAVHVAAPPAPSGGSGKK